jgi:uncharacterized coiled-coil protein SlyX
MAKHSTSSALRAAIGARWRRYAVAVGVAAAVVAVVGGVAGASSTTSEGIVSITPHVLTGGSALGAGQSVAFVVSGGATTVPTDATRVQFSVTVKNQARAGTLSGQPYLDAADASGDSLSWPASNTTVTGTFLEPVGVSNKVSFINTSAGTVTVVIKITGFSTPGRLANRIDALESRLNTDEQIIAQQGNTIKQQAGAIAEQSNIVTRQGSAIGSLQRQMRVLLDFVPGLRLVLESTSSQAGASLTANLAIEGVGLRPGSVVGLIDKDGAQPTKFLVDADGIIQTGSNGWSCSRSPFHVTATNQLGATLTSNTVSC